MSYIQPDIPFSEYEKKTTRDIFIVVKPIALMIEQGEISEAREMLARLTLWFIDQIEQDKLEPIKARNSYFILFIYLTDNYPGDILGEDAQELIYEGTMLHYLGHDESPDLNYVRLLANGIMANS